MKTANSSPVYAMPRWLRPWEQFWFTPADPTLLALIRICCGMLVSYTIFVHGLSLQDFMGENAWLDLKYRLDFVREKPVLAIPLSGYEYERAGQAKNPWEVKYYNDYRQKWGYPPPAPYPKDDAEAKFLEDFHVRYAVDLRMRGLPIPQTPEQKAYAEEYTLRWKLPPPAYPKDDRERREAESYLERHGHDPRAIYAQGSPLFSIWFHVTDPQAMQVVHSLFVTAAVLFTLGFCTRITAAITWFANLCYIQRDPVILFGADTMYTILLLYLMIGPSGAAFSLDRLIRRWWRGAKPGVVQGWYRLWRLPVPDASQIAPVAYSELPEPSVSANVAIRLLQIHICIIYFMSGISKLLGQTWWTGYAIWNVIANYEIAPMQYEFYLKFLRFLGDNWLIREVFLTGGCLFTLAFEVGYAFLIWRPRLRWVFLASAILLHGLIGMFMGLKTFSLIMLVMNMAFLRKEEALWLLNRLAGVLRWLLSWTGMAVAAPKPAPKPAAV